MNFKQKSLFEFTVKAAVSEEKDKYIATASLLNLAQFLPDMDIEKNQDCLFCSFNGAVINHANKNGDVMGTDVALATIKSFVNKPINIGHNRKKVIGVITNYGFSEFGTNKPLTEDEVKGMTGPFNLVLGGVLWRLVDPDLCNYIEECSMPGATETISTSWEVGFNDNDILVTDGSRYLSDGFTIAEGDINFEKYSKALIMNGGSGKVDGYSVYRNILSPALGLGFGVTENPAAQVSGILTSSAVQGELDTTLAKVTYLNQELYKNVRKDADDKFGGENSYVKNLWVLKEYKKRGGKTRYSGKKPSGDDIEKSVSKEIYCEIDEYEENEECSAEEKVKRALNKPFRTPGGPKKFAVYVKNDKGNVVLVRFGDPNMEIKRDDPERRKSFRARHKCDQQKDKTKPAYWSCKMWSNKNVSDLT